MEIDMEMNKKLLTVAVSSALLAACGGGSSGGSGEQAPYTLTEADALPAGKAFVAKFSETVSGAAEAAGTFGGSLTSSLFDTAETPAGSVDTAGLKAGLGQFVQSLAMVGPIAEQLRSEAEHKTLWDEYNQIVLGNIYTFEDLLCSGPGCREVASVSGNDGVRFQYMEDEQGNLLVNVMMTLTDTDSGSESNVTMALQYNRISAVENDILVSGSFSNEMDAISIELADITFKTNSLLTGPTFDVTVGSINATLSDVTVTASASMALVAGNPSATVGTAQLVPYLDTAYYLAAPFSGLGPQISHLLNISSTEITGLKVENDLGQYLSLNAMYEDADAADFIGGSEISGYGGYDVSSYGGISSISYDGDVAAYEISEDLNTLVLSDNYGKTTYALIQKEREIVPAPAEPVFDRYITCVSEDASAFFTAPTYYDMRSLCNEEGVQLDSSAKNLIEFLAAGRDDRLRYTEKASLSGTYLETDYVTDNSYLDPNQSELTGTIGIWEYRSTRNNGSTAFIDSVVEPVTFSVSTNGELGLADGNVIPFTASLNHPYAHLYDVDVTVGTEGNEVSVDFSTGQNVTVFSGSVAYTGDATLAATDVTVTFEIDHVEPEEPVEGDPVVGTLKVDGTVVGALKRVSGPTNSEAKDSSPLYVEFADGTYPQDGGLFETVADLRQVDCPAPEGVQELAVENCYEDQAGMIDLKTLSNTFFAGMPIDGPFWEAPAEENAPQ
jgi:hypothetical protein